MFLPMTSLCSHVRRLRSWTALLALCMIGIPLHAQTVSTDGGEAVLQPGDVVRITVWRKPELSGELVVATDSSLKHPLFQEVKVGGVPLAIAKERLREFLVRYESDPQFVIEPLFRVGVGGEVRSPNLYSWPRETTIAQAIALAGGPTERGRLDRILLIRDGRTVKIDLTNPASGWANAPIHSGDRIGVARRRDLLRDYAAPVASVTAALVSVIAIITR
jgi:protein involved in polysaccharide export with SLBB domain